VNREFQVVGSITDVETIAVGRKIRELQTLQAQFGRGRWRKFKGIATVCLSDGTVRLAEWRNSEYSTSAQRDLG
jgi:hypothetical protein